MENYKLLLSIHVTIHIILYEKDRFLFFISKEDKVVLGNDIENIPHRFHRSSQIISSLI